MNGLIKTKPELVDKVGIQPIPQGPSGKGDRGGFLGTYGMSTRLYPTGVTGLTDRYTDVALDAQYERKMGQGSITAHSTWIHEAQNLAASVPLTTSA